MDIFHTLCMYSVWEHYYKQTVIKKVWDNRSNFLLVANYCNLECLL